MSEVELRRAYYEGRILIEAARILDSPFDDSLVCLSGAELELMRNLTAYLHRRSTFVDTYHDGYYVMPDEENWDDVSAVVASLEEKLMGCAEIEANIQAIADRMEPLPLAGVDVEASTGAEISLYSDTVPAGYIHRIQRAVCYCSLAWTQVIIWIHTEALEQPIHQQATIGGWEMAGFDSVITVHEGEYLRARLTGVPNGYGAYFVWAGELIKL